MNFSGTLYTSATLVATGNSGWVTWPGGFGDAGSSRVAQPTSGLFEFIPAALATDETMDLTLSVSSDSSGTGATVIHAFTQVTSTNAQETLLLPGGESTSLGGTGGMPLGQYFKLGWVLAGSTKSMSFTMYCNLSGIL